MIQVYESPDAPYHYYSTTPILSRYVTLWCIIIFLHYPQPLALCDESGATCPALLADYCDNINVRKIIEITLCLVTFSPEARS